MTNEPHAAPATGTDALNGRACCLLDLSCCIPPAGSTTAQMQETTMAQIIREALVDAGYEGLSVSDCAAAARGILRYVDLVPKGVGAAIAKGYSRFMKGAAGKEKP
jgi:hypothetical protein